MTITGLWNLLGQHVSPSIVNLKKESASFLNRNKKKLCIGIDASIYLYLALKNPKTIKELAIDFVLNHDISNFLHSYFENLRQFLVAKCHCDIILVFDGASHPNKTATQEARRRASDSAKIALKEFIGANKYSEDALDKILKDLVRPNGPVLASVKCWADKHNVKCIGSPFEADWQLAHLFQKKAIDYVLSSDGDIIVYGATIIKNVDFKKGTVEVFNWAHIIEFMLDQFGESWSAIKNTDVQIFHVYSFCALLGCDYLDAPTNFGPKTVISKFKECWFGEVSARTRLLDDLETGGVKCNKNDFPV